MDIFKQIIDARAQGQSFVLATIVDKKGSAPREVGARMIVYIDGTTHGTVGGGKFEKLVIDDCLDLLNSDRDHRLKRYRLTERGEDATGMNCGGEAELFMERFGPMRKLIIFGGGHVGRELARVSDGLGFAITIVDDRSDVLGDYQAPINTVLTDSTYHESMPPLDEHCYVVAVTRSHETDGAVLQHALNHNCAYVGMIGSKAKVAKLFASLEESGVERSRLDRVHAPIGLDIDAEGPAEIAVAIAAELIAVKNRLPKQS